VVRLTRTKGQALHVGDVIIRVGNAPVPDPPALFAALSGETIGRPTRVDVVRDGRATKLVVKPWALDA
jgi:S1-C subfamily serine protease